MKEINLEELKNIQLDILQYVHDFCIDNNIQYSLMYGTLLGAVRHKGYIPWDDDIDIAMLREDYEKFAASFNKVISPYHFYDCRNDKEVNISIGKVADTRTLVEEGCNSKNLGVSIDVFPVDDMCDTFEESEKYYRTYDLLKTLLIFKVRKISDVRSWWKKPVFAIVKILFCWYPTHQAAITINKRLLEHKNPLSKFVGTIDMVFVDEIFERKMYQEYQEMDFEGHKFMAIKDYDTFLKKRYGDYMQLPPEDQRVPHHDFFKIYWL